MWNVLVCKFYYKHQQTTRPFLESLPGQTADGKKQINKGTFTYLPPWIDVGMFILNNFINLFVIFWINLEINGFIVCENDVFVTGCGRPYID